MAYPIVHNADFKETWESNFLKTLKKRKCWSFGEGLMDDLFIKVREIVLPLLLFLNPFPNKPWILLICSKVF